MAMQVRPQAEEIPTPRPSSKDALAQGIEESGKPEVRLTDLNLIEVSRAAFRASNTNLNLGIQPVVLPEFRPNTVPETPKPKPKAKVVPIKPKVQKQKKQQKEKVPEIKTEANRQTDGEDPDETPALQAWLREYASIGVDPSVAEVSGRTKAQATDGRMVKVNRVLACFLVDGDKWGGSQMWDRNYGPPVDGIVNAVDYPTREKYKQRERGSEKARVALAHESVPPGEEWEASAFSKKRGNVQGFEGFARPPSMDDLWFRHHMRRCGGDLSDPTVYERTELKGFTFYVDHGKGIVGPSCKVIDPQGNRFSYPFNFFNGRVSYVDAKAQCHQVMMSAVDRLLSPARVDVQRSTQSMPAVELVQYGTAMPASNEDIAKETIRTLAEVMPRPPAKVVNEEFSRELYQLKSRRLYRWFSRADRSTAVSRSKEMYQRRVVEEFQAIEQRRAHQRAFNRHLQSLGVIGPRGILQSFFRENEERWYECNAVSQESRARRPYLPVSDDPYDQMKTHWVYQHHCGRITREQLGSILTRIISRQKAASLHLLLLDEKKLPAGVPSNGHEFRGIDLVPSVSKILEGEVFENRKTRLSSRVYAESPSGLLVPTDYLNDRIEPWIGDLDDTVLELPSQVVPDEDITDMIEVNGVMVPNLRHLMRQPSNRPSKWERIGEKLHRVGEFLAAVAPK